MSGGDPYAPPSASQRSLPSARPRHDLPPGATAHYGEPRPGPSIELVRDDPAHVRSHDAASLRSTSSRANLTGGTEPTPPLPHAHGFHTASRPSSPRPTMSEKPRSAPGYMMPVDFGGTTKSAGMSRQSTGDWEPQASGMHSPRQHPYGKLNAASVSDPNLLQFAEGDFGRTRAARIWLSLLQSNIVVRWALFILPLTALLWIPGIVDLTNQNRGYTVFSVRLLFWSIWLTSA